MILQVADIVPAPPIPLNERATAVFRGFPASLTTALAANGAFVGALLPNSRAAVAAINKTVRSRSFISPCADTVAARIYSNVALAVDRGVLYFYGIDIVSDSRARLLKRGKTGKHIAALLASYQPPEHGVLRSRSALGWFYHLGMLDTILRGFRPLTDVDHSLLPGRVTRRSTIGWLESLIPPDVAEEIAELLRSVRDSRVPGRVRANPVFGALGWMIGSDGDWIAGETLVELKCTVGGIKREHIAQLLCYYALDCLCPFPQLKFDISSLAVCLPRHRCSIAGSVDEWIAAFGAPSRATLPSFVNDWCCSG